MGLASRLFLLSPDDTLHSLASAAFMRMLRGEDVARALDFAGERVRQAHIVIEVVDRRPTRMVHWTFSVLTFDGSGRLDVERFNTQQFARMGDPLRPVRSTSRDGVAIDAATRFIARGGSWQPDERLLRRIEAAALGRLSGARVRVVR